MQIGVHKITNKQENVLAFRLILQGILDIYVKINTEFVKNIVAKPILDLVVEVCF